MRMTLPMGDSCGNKRFSIALADDGDVAGKGHVFLVKVAAITERECIGDKKTSIRSDNRETWRCLNPVINGLAFQVAPEALQANLRRVSLHQFVITLRLLIADVAAVLVLFLHVGTAGVDVHRVFRELKDIRSKKTDPLSIELCNAPIAVMTRMIENTPMVMPVIVSAARNLFAPSELSAIAMISLNRII
jgi:hypothetical protein